MCTLFNLKAILHITIISPLFVRVFLLLSVFSICFKCHTCIHARVCYSLHQCWSGEDGNPGHHRHCSGAAAEGESGGCGWDHQTTPQPENEDGPEPCE